MYTGTSEDYISNRAWLRSIASKENIILRNVSALEFLELFVGYAYETSIEVYAKEKGKYNNVDYRVVDTFDGIEYIKFDNVLCSTVNQAINDMLHEYDITDEQALIEALSNYYYSHNNTFNGLNIVQENIIQFNKIKEQAIEYYCGG